MAKRKAKRKRARTRKADDSYIEQHGATEPATIWDSGKQTATGARIRQKDAALQRLLRDFGPMHVQAAEEIEAGQRSLAVSMGAVSVQYGERTPGAAYRGLAVSLIAERFIRWGQACTTSRPLIDYPCVVGVICNGLGLREAEVNARRRHGWAARQIERGLDLWLDLNSRRRRERVVHSIATS